jgi:hypothetical protein
MSAMIKLWQWFMADWQDTKFSLELCICWSLPESERML